MHSIVMQLIAKDSNERFYLLNYWFLYFENLSKISARIWYFC